MLRAEGISSKHETEANQFAADLLMPLKLVNQLIAEELNTLPAFPEKLVLSKVTLSIKMGVPA